MSRVIWLSSLILLLGGGVAKANDNTIHWVGAKSSNTFQNRWQHDLVSADETCGGFIKKMDLYPDAERKYYTGLDGQRYRFIDYMGKPTADGSGKGVDNVDIVMVCTHGGIYNYDIWTSFTVVMWDDPKTDPDPFPDPSKEKGRAFGMEMRLGDDGRGLSIYTSDTCLIMSPQENRWFERWYWAFAGGLRFASASWNKNPDVGGLDQGTRYADALHAPGATLRLTWLDTMGKRDTQSPAVMASGRTKEECVARLSKMTWQGFEVYNRLRDADVKYLCMTRRVGDALSESTSTPPDDLDKYAPPCSSLEYVFPTGGRAGMQVVERRVGPGANRVVRALEKVLVALSDEEQLDLGVDAWRRERADGNETVFGDGWRLRVFGDGTNAEFVNEKAIARASLEGVGSGGNGGHLRGGIKNDRLVRLGRDFIEEYLAGVSNVVRQRDLKDIAPLYAFRDIDQESTKDSVTPERVSLNTVVFSRRMDGRNIIGRGAKISVSYTGDETPVAFDFDWADYRETGRVQEIADQATLRARLSSWIASHHGAPVTRKESWDVVRSECGYFDDDYIGREKDAVLKPSCYVEIKESSPLVSIEDKRPIGLYLPIGLGR